MAAIEKIEPLGHGPFSTDSPFLFAVHHNDVYPKGNESLGPDASLSGRDIGQDFGHPSGWSMYHGSDGVPGFPKHPHRGFETISISKHGYIDHTDSLGNAGRFGDGDVQWMTAGSGISHAEMFPMLKRDAPNRMEMFQIWLNLPRASKMVDADFKMLWAEQIPTRTLNDGCEVRLVAGVLEGFAAPPSPPTNSYALADASRVLVCVIELPAGAKWTLPALASSPSSPSSLSGVRRNAYLFDPHGGSCVIDGRVVATRHRVTLRCDAAVAFEATGERVGVLVLQGRDIGEPVTQHGPFVGNTRQDIMQAFQDYQRTGFGGWPWPSEAMPHAREAQRFATFADGRHEEFPRLS